MSDIIWPTPIPPPLAEAVPVQTIQFDPVRQEVVKPKTVEYFDDVVQNDWLELSYVHAPYIHSPPQLLSPFYDYSKLSTQRLLTIYRQARKESLRVGDPERIKSDADYELEERERRSLEAMKAELSRREHVQRERLVGKKQKRKLKYKRR